MSRLETTDAVWARMTGPLPFTGAAESGNGDPKEREAWKTVIEGRLADWARNPALLEDEGVEAPSVKHPPLCQPDCAGAL